MSTFAVNAVELKIFPHPNADALELARVGLYHAVVPKDEYVTGDYAIYIPEQAVLPDELIEELGLTGKLAGKHKNRVKAIRLRQELSQGIVCLPDKVVQKVVQEAGTRKLQGKYPDLSLWQIFLQENGEDYDFAELLGITKYVPEIPVHMAGKVIDGSQLLKWEDIENLKRFPDVFETGEEVVITEKIHGTCCIMTYIPSEDPGTKGVVLVSSKGLADKHLALEFDEGNLYWRAIIGHLLPGFASRIAKAYQAVKVGLYGEVYGAGVQDLTYGESAKESVPGYALFDVRVQFSDGQTLWLTPEEISMLPLKPQRVPELYRGPFDMDIVWALANGPETVSGNETHIREGVVIRSANERRSQTLGGRAILKAVSEDYLLRKNGTEYE